MDQFPPPFTAQGDYSEVTRNTKENKGNKGNTQAAFAKAWLGKLQLSTLLRAPQSPEDPAPPHVLPRQLRVGVGWWRAGSPQVRPALGIKQERGGGQEEPYFVLGGPGFKNEFGVKVQRPKTGPFPSLSPSFPSQEN